MLKMEKEYDKDYGSIPKRSVERLTEYLQTIKPSKWKESIFDDIKRLSSVKWKKESFIVYLLPKATPRPRSTSNGSFFYVKGASDNKKFFLRNVKDMDLPMICTPCKFNCVAYLPIPKSMNPKDQILAEFGFIRPISKPDFDNIVKTYTDMLQDVILVDDALIVEGTSMKYYSWKPRIEFSIEYMEDFDCDFNKKKILKRKE
jgi:Holliday junction resolvase RusA-like endonuclease